MEEDTDEATMILYMPTPPREYSLQVTSCVATRESYGSLSFHSLELGDNVDHLKGSSFHGGIVAFNLKMCSASMLYQIVLSELRELHEDAPNGNL